LRDDLKLAGTLETVFEEIVLTGLEEIRVDEAMLLGKFEKTLPEEGMLAIRILDGALAEDAIEIDAGFEGMILAGLEETSVDDAMLLGKLDAAFPEEGMLAIRRLDGALTEDAILTEAVDEGFEEIILDGTDETCPAEAMLTGEVDIALINEATLVITLEGTLIEDPILNAALEEGLEEITVPADRDETCPEDTILPGVAERMWEDEGMFEIILDKDFEEGIPTEPLDGDFKEIMLEGTEETSADDTMLATLDETFADDFWLIETGEEGKLTGRLDKGFDETMLLDFKLLRGIDVTTDE
jgi:hypothetical protein